jgi:hypothetical protein
LKIPRFTSVTLLGFAASVGTAVVVATNAFSGASTAASGRRGLAEEKAGTAPRGKERHEGEEGEVASRGSHRTKASVAATTKGTLQCGAAVSGSPCV